MTRSFDTLRALIDADPARRAKVEQHKRLWQEHLGHATWWRDPPGVLHCDDCGRDRERQTKSNPSAGGE